MRQGFKDLAHETVTGISAQHVQEQQVVPSPSPLGQMKREVKHVLPSSALRDAPTSCFSGLSGTKPICSIPQSPWKPGSGALPGPQQELCSKLCFLGLKWQNPQPKPLSTCTESQTGTATNNSCLLQSLNADLHSDITL